MKVDYVKYTEEDVIFVKWETGFEESVIESLFGEHGAVIAKRTSNCITLEKMPEDLKKIINKYYRKKEKQA